MTAGNPRAIRLSLILGTKVEHNDYTGFEVQPSARLSWSPTERQAVWASIARAVRTPARAQRNFTFYVDLPPNLPPLPLPVLIVGEGNPEFDSEELLAHEIGYRLQPHPRLSLDVAAFDNDYDRLYNVISTAPQLRLSPAAEPYIYMSASIDNDFYGETYGSETSVTWQPLDTWRLRGSYTFLKMNLHTQQPSPSLTEDEEGSNPAHQWSVWSDLDLGHQVECGVGLRCVDGLPSRVIRDYTELDVCLTWKPTARCQITLVGRNLLQARHQEYSPIMIGTRNVEVERAVYGKVTLRF